MHLCNSFKKISLHPLVFFHPGQENLMADDTSHLFNLPNTPFLSHIMTIHLESTKGVYM